MTKLVRWEENPDEIVLEEVEMFHLESMNERSLWVGIYTQDKKIYHLNIHADGDKLRYYWATKRRDLERILADDQMGMVY
jgi:hypothetical protein